MGGGVDRGGTYVISLEQTSMDGFRAPTPEDFVAGTVMTWDGEPVRIDGSPSSFTSPDILAGRNELRQRAQRSAWRLLGRSRNQPEPEPPVFAAEDVPPAHSFSLTDGRNIYPAAILQTEPGRPALAFLDGLPPRNVDLFVSGLSPEPAPAEVPGTRGGIICFTSGTMINTPDGPCPVEAIRPGDRISTRDDGAQEILWTGSRRMSGARLYAMPHLRPVRIRSGAMGQDRPEGDLLVSPDHRILVRGTTARALFNEDEVLVTARDLIDGCGVQTEPGFRDVTYHHILSARHQVLWANGLETESFHPAAADLDMIDAAQREMLFAALPGLRDDAFQYGDWARRSLSASEAAILRYEAA